MAKCLGWVVRPNTTPVAVKLANDTVVHRSGIANGLLLKWCMASQYNILSGWCYFWGDPWYAMAVASLFTVGLVDKVYKDLLVSF